MRVPVRHDVSMGVEDFPRVHETLHELREAAPVAEVLYLGTPHLILLTYEGLRDALRNEELFPSVESYSQALDPAVGRTLNSMQGEEHTRNRSIVSPTFRRQRMAQCGDELIRPVMHRLLDAVAGREEVDLRSVFTHLAPMIVITELLGLPGGDHENLERWANALFTYPTDPAGALLAKAEMTTFLEHLMAERRSVPKNDLVSVLVNGEFERRVLSDEEILSFLRLLFPAGTHNTTNSISTLLYALLVEPSRMERMRAEPESRRWAVEEALRWEPSVANLQRKARPTGGEWHGIDIAPGADLIYSFAAAARDPAMYECPDEFDLDRHPTEILTFGLGEHFCLGAWLAREEMRVALDVIIERTRDVSLVDRERAAPKGCTLRGPVELPVRIVW